MIIDNLENIDLYFGLGENIRSALLFLKQNQLIEMKDGRYEINGSTVYASVSRYKTKPIESGKWESHKRYIDIQFLIEGSEHIGYSNISKMKIIDNYNEDKDVQFLEGPGNFFTAQKNTFVILYPHDVHMPGIFLSQSQQNDVTKIVIKVKAD